MRREDGKNVATWALVVALGRDNDGKYRYQWHTFKGTRSDAQDEMRRLLAKRPSASGLSTMATFAREYLAAQRHRLSPTTLFRYADIIDREIVPALGHLRLSAIGPRDLQQAYTTWLRRLSPQTVLHHHRLLFTILGQAVRWEAIDRNPAALVDPPRVRRAQLRPPTIEQALDILRKLKGTRLEIPVLLAIATGARRGEICALRWSDVNLKTGVVTIGRSIINTGSQTSFAQPKTKGSNRQVVLPKWAGAQLRAFKARQDLNRTSLGSAWQENDLIVSDPLGQPWNPNNLTRSWCEGPLEASSHTSAFTIYATRTRRGSWRWACRPRW